jgi:hypothetical protein
MGAKGIGASLGRGENGVAGQLGGKTIFFLGIKYFNRIREGQRQAIFSGSRP